MRLRTCCIFGHHWLAVAVRASAFDPSTSFCLSRPPPLAVKCGIDDLHVALSRQESVLPEALSYTSDSSIPAVSTRPSDSITPVRQDWKGPIRCAGPYCVYANTGSVQGGGLVVVTTESNLRRLQRRLEQGGDANSPTIIPSSAYYVAMVAGKGLGFIANATLRRGDIVMSQLPSVIIQKSFLLNSRSKPQYAALLDTAVENLSADTRGIFLSQMAHMGGPRIFDILLTNSFMMDLGGGHAGAHYVNYPIVSRFNHDCRPNAVWRLDINQGLRHTTTIARDMEPGEEITISYLDSQKPRAERLRRTRFAWGFSCTCAQCRLSSKESTESDERLRKIDKIGDMLSDTEQSGSRVTPALLESYVGLLRAERLEFDTRGAFTLVAIHYNMLGDAGMASKYAKVAYEAAVIEAGPEAEDAHAMLSLQEAPEKHFTWRLRA